MWIEVCIFPSSQYFQTITFLCPDCIYQINNVRQHIQHGVLFWCKRKVQYSDTISSKSKFGSEFWHGMRDVLIYKFSQYSVWMNCGDLFSFSRIVKSQEIFDSLNSRNSLVLEAIREICPLLEISNISMQMSTIIQTPKLFSKNSEIPGFQGFPMPGQWNHVFVPN